jgi:hypothetical protein
MKRSKRIAIARIRDGPDGGLMAVTEGHERGREGQEDALRVSSKDLGQVGHHPSAVPMGYVRRVGAKKQTFDNQFHYLEEKRLWAKKKV